MPETTTQKHIQNLAIWIEAHLRFKIHSAVNLASKMLYENWYLVGPTDSTAQEMLMAKLKTIGIECTREEFTTAALLLRETNLRKCLPV